jgi:hypothetical protein
MIITGQHMLLAVDSDSPAGPLTAGPSRLPGPSHIPGPDSDSESESSYY